MKKRFSFILFLLAFVTSYAQKGNLYFFTIIQEDEGIGSEQDGGNMNNLVKEIAGSIHYQLTAISIPSTEFTRIRLMQEIRKYTYNSKDVIWVYYSGHGRNYDTWPETDESELPISAVDSLLKHQNAHLTLAMYDCCTSEMPQILAKNKEYTTCSFNFYGELFVKTAANIKIASASSQQYAYGSHLSGGNFTNCFIDALRMGAVWENILSNAKMTTNNMAKEQKHIQNPQYNIVSK